VGALPVLVVPSPKSHNHDVEAGALLVVLAKTTFSGTVPETGNAVKSAVIGGGGSALLISLENALSPLASTDVTAKK
jgi:hypothetical protein